MVVPQCADGVEVAGPFAEAEPSDSDSEESKRDRPTDAAASPRDSAAAEAVASEPSEAPPGEQGAPVLTIGDGTINAFMLKRSALPHMAAAAK